LWDSVKRFIALDKDSVFIKLKEMGICIRNARWERRRKIISRIKSQTWRKIMKCSSSSFRINLLNIFVKGVCTKSRKMSMGCRRHHRYTGRSRCAGRDG